MICIWSSWCHCHPVVSCFIKIQIDLTFLGSDYPGCPGKEAAKRVRLSNYGRPICNRAGHYIFALWFLSSQRRQKSPSGHYRTILSGYIFATKVRIDNRKKIVKQQYLLHMSAQYGELRLTSGWDLLASLGHPCKFQRVSRFGSVTARHFGSGRQPNFAALNRGRHLCSAGRPSGWSLAHILVSTVL